MAYAITASKWLEDKRYIEAVLDSASDLAALGSGYAPDSRAIVADGGAAYMTDASGQWQELGSPGGGGGGGSSVTVEPLTVTQNGTYTPDAGVDGFDKVDVDVPSPNYIETISGTLANPWGDYSFRNDLAPKILSNEIDLNITFSFNESVYVAFPNLGSLAAITHICSAYSISATTAKLSLLRYTPGGTLQSAKVVPELRETDGVWSGSGTSLEPTTPCTLTIIHHPMPDSE